MKLSLRLISSLVVCICAVTFIIARNQVNAEKAGLRADVARQGEILTESLQETIEPVLQQHSTTQLRRIVDRFDDRQHLAGIAVYDGGNALLAASDKLGRQAQPAPAVVAEAAANNEGTGEFTTVGSTLMYIYALPLHYGNNGTGVLVTFQDASDIGAQSTRV